MTMADIFIDFTKLVRNQHKTLFAGRANGRRASEFFGVDNFDVEKNDILLFKIPQDIVISSSYFLGMLENILPNFRSAAEFYSRARLGNQVYEAGMLKELDRAVERGLYKNEPFF
ncbi:hypothetical protein ACS780_20625 [Yersinia enterocolitica]|uniref:hypothetical protein n=1 Tax=Yersinia enterocolitica TaxID=630 RepID=UPI003F458CCD